MSEQHTAGSQGAYRLIERCVEEVIGADIAEHLSGRITRCVDSAVERLELTSPMGHLNALQTGDERSEALLDELLASVLVHETFFYRFASQLEALEREVMRPLAANRTGGVIKLWSAGCSQGPEAYTLAMLGAHSTQTTGSDLIVDVLGTDLCNAFLAEARRATYSAARIKELPKSLCDRFLKQLGDDSYTLTDELCRAVRFHRHNLLEAPPDRGFDVICCRNVLMYLRPAARRTALEHLSGALAPHGVLLVGHSESLRDVDDLFVPHDRLALGIYGRRIEGEDDTSGSSRPERPQEPREARRAPIASVQEDRIAVTSADKNVPSVQPATKTAVEPEPRHRLLLEGEYDHDRDPERLTQLKARLGEIIDLGLDVVVEANGATCLDQATATLIARAARAIATRGRHLSVVATRPSVRRWAERHRLPIDESCKEEGLK